MSHFTVGIILPAIDIENEAAIALAIEMAMMPYHEFECTGINEYIQDIDETEEYIKKYLNETHEVVCLADGTFKSKYDCSFSRPATEEEVKAIELYESSGDHFDRKKELQPGFPYSTSYSGDKKNYTRLHAYPDDSEIVNILYYEHQSFYEFIKYQISDEFNLIPLNDGPDLEEANKYGYIRLIGEERDTADMSKEDLERYIKETYQVINRTNLDKKWDWYQVGGRWTGMIRKKDGTTADICKIADINFEPDQSQYNKALRFWEIVVEDFPLLPGETELFNFYKKEYYLNRYKTKENYALDQASFGTFAMIDLDGKWYECGSMGWFGFSDDTKESADEFQNLFNRRLLNADGDCIFAVVDCHI